MTAAQILSDAINAKVGETDSDSITILEDAIAAALPLFKTEVLDAFHEGEDSGFASASVVADRVLG